MRLTLSQVWFLGGISFLRRDVLRWIIPRQKPIQALQPSINFQDLQDRDMDQEEIKLFRLVGGSATPDSTGEDLANLSRLFWCMAKMVDSLAEWGHGVLTWMSGCPCPNPKPCTDSKGKNHCVLKGRRAIELAAGRSSQFRESLSRATLTELGREAHTELSKFDPEKATSLLNEWNTAKCNMLLRIEQHFSCWTERPWSLLQIGECLVVEASVAK